MRRRAHKSGGHHGEKFFQTGFRNGCVGSHVWDLRLIDLSALGHLASHENKEVECSCAGLFIDLLGRDNDFGEDGRNEVEACLWEVLDND